MASTQPQGMSNQTSAGPGGVPQRPKAPTACMSCRARKLKCSGERPTCSNCPLYGAACEYAAGRAKSGPPKGSRRVKKDGSGHQSSGDGNQTGTGSPPSSTTSAPPIRATASATPSSSAAASTNPFSPPQQQRASHSYGSQGGSASGFVAPQQHTQQLSGEFTFSAPGNFATPSWSALDSSAMSVDPSSLGMTAGPPQEASNFDPWSALYNPVSYLDVPGGLRIPPQHTTSPDPQQSSPDPNQFTTGTVDPYPQQQSSMQQQQHQQPSASDFVAGHWDVSGMPYHQLESVFEQTIFGTSTGAGTNGELSYGSADGVGPFGPSTFGGHASNAFPQTNVPDGLAVLMGVVGDGNTRNGTSDSNNMFDFAGLASATDSVRGQYGNGDRSQSQPQRSPAPAQHSSPSNGTGLSMSDHDRMLRMEYQRPPENDIISLFADPSKSLTMLPLAHSQQPIPTTGESSGTATTSAPSLSHASPANSTTAPSPAHSGGSSDHRNPRLGPDAKRLARVHQFIPLLPFPVAETLLSHALNLAVDTPGSPFSSGGGGGDDYAGEARRFAALALLALIKVTDVVSPNDLGRPGGVDADPVYARAQQLAMPAYLDASSRGGHNPTNPNIPWTDSRALSAAGLAYLAVRQVLTRGWCREAATFLRLAAGVVEGLPGNSIIRLWFSRVILLWDLGLGLAATPYGPLRLQRAASGSMVAAVVTVHQQLREAQYLAHTAAAARASEGATPASNDDSTSEADTDTSSRPTPDGLLASRIPALDGDARVFDSLVALALDLCFPPPSDRQNVFTYDGLGMSWAQYEPLRVQRWLEALPPTLSSGTLQMVSVPQQWVRPTQISYSPPYVVLQDDAAHIGAGPMERVDRQAVSRVVQLVYYTLCTRYYKPLSLAPNVAPPPSLHLSHDPSGADTALQTGAAHPMVAPSVRMATIRAAMANIVDTADWFIHTRHYWLWPFAEQGLVFAQNSALGRVTNPKDGSSVAYGKAVEGMISGKGEEVTSPSTSGASTGASPPAVVMGKRSRETAEASSRDEGNDAPEDEENLRDVLAAGAQIPPDAPRRGLLLMIQDVLSAALDAFTVAPFLGSGHVASTRVLLTVAAAALSGANNSTARPLLFIQRRIAGGMKMKNSKGGDGAAEGERERPAVRMRTEHGAVAIHRAPPGAGAGSGQDMVMDMFPSGGWTG